MADPVDHIAFGRWTQVQHIEAGPQAREGWLGQEQVTAGAQDAGLLAVIDAGGTAAIVAAAAQPQTVPRAGLENAGKARLGVSVAGMVGGAMSLVFALLIGFALQARPGRR